MQDVKQDRNYCYDIQMIMDLDVSNGQKIIDDDILMTLTLKGSFQCTKMLSG